MSKLLQNPDLLQRATASQGIIVQNDCFYNEDQRKKIEKEQKKELDKRSGKKGNGKGAQSHQDHPKAKREVSRKKNIHQSSSVTSNDDDEGNSDEDDPENTQSTEKREQSPKRPSLEEPMDAEDTQQGEDDERSDDEVISHPRTQPKGKSSSAKGSSATIIEDVTKEYEECPSSPDSTEECENKEPPSPVKKEPSGHKSDAHKKKKKKKTQSTPSKSQKPTTKPSATTRPAKHSPTESKRTEPETRKKEEAGGQDTKRKKRRDEDECGDNGEEGEDEDGWNSEDEWEYKQKHGSAPPPVQTKGTKQVPNHGEEPKENMEEDPILYKRYVLYVRPKCDICKRTEALIRSFEQDVWVQNVEEIPKEHRPRWLRGVPTVVRIDDVKSEKICLFEGSAAQKELYEYGLSCGGGGGNPSYNYQCPPSQQPASQSMQYDHSIPTVHDGAERYTNPEETISSDDIEKYNQRRDRARQTQHPVQHPAPGDSYYNGGGHPSYYDTNYPSESSTTQNYPPPLYSDNYYQQSGSYTGYEQNDPAHYYSNSSSAYPAAHHQTRAYPPPPPPPHEYHHCQ